jgi:hypothetical protein
VSGIAVLREVQLLAAVHDGQPVRGQRRLELADLRRPRSFRRVFPRGADGDADAGAQVERRVLVPGGGVAVGEPCGEEDRPGPLAEDDAG